jgi:hypothetical protein
MEGVRQLAEAFFLAEPFRNKESNRRSTLAFRVHTSRIAKITSTFTVKCASVANSISSRDASPYLKR